MWFISHRAHILFLHMEILWPENQCCQIVTWSPVLCLGNSSGQQKTKAKMASSLVSPSVLVSTLYHTWCTIHFCLRSRIAEGAEDRAWLGEQQIRDVLLLPCLPWCWGISWYRIDPWIATSSKFTKNCDRKCVSGGRGSTFLHYCYIGWSLVRAQLDIIVCADPTFKCWGHFREKFSNISLASKLPSLKCW